MRKPPRVASTYRPEAPGSNLWSLLACQAERQINEHRPLRDFRVHPLPLDRDRREALRLNELIDSGEAEPRSCSANHVGKGNTLVQKDKHGRENAVACEVAPTLLNQRSLADAESVWSQVPTHLIPVVSSARLWDLCWKPPHMERIKPQIFMVPFPMQNPLPLHAEGLVLLTNDGYFAHTLRDPNNKVVSVSPPVLAPE